ncbi:MAG: hypothetical protein ACK56I_23025 [bacterium]
MAARHLACTAMYWQLWQQGEFLSEQMLPSFSVQFSLQQGSRSSEPSRPASHSSSPSTRRLPQNDSSGSVKHRDDLASNTLRMNRSEQGENFLLLTS